MMRLPQPGTVNTAGIPGLGFAMVQAPAQLRAGEPAPHPRSVQYMRACKKQFPISSYQLADPPASVALASVVPQNIVITNTVAGVALKLTVPTTPGNVNFFGGCAPREGRAEDQHQLALPRPGCGPRPGLHGHHCPLRGQVRCSGCWPAGAHPLLGEPKRLLGRSEGLLGHRARSCGLS